MVRVRLRYADLETFIERFAPNVTRGGVFLASRTPRPEGDLFTFEIQLANGSVALAGEGKVIWVKPFNPAEPNKPHGMGVQFVRVDPASRDVLARILQAKGSGAPRAAGRSLSQPVVPLQGAGGSGPIAVGSSGNNGLNGRPRVDTGVDLAAEYGIDEATLRRVIDRNWALGSRSDEELQDLLKADPLPPVTLAQALADLPRLLNPAARRRTGAFRALETLAPAEKKAPPATPAPSSPDEPLTGDTAPEKGVA
jgi:uncharacterized protein (TIGR02266 family)